MWHSVRLRPVRAALLALLLALLGPPAQAAPGDAVLLSLSPSGPWAQNLSTSPFSSMPAKWVPGDSAAGTLYVVSAACTGVTGTIAVTYQGTGQDLAQVLSLTASLDGYGPEPIGSTFAITGNEIHRIDLTATLPFGTEASTGNQSQGEVLANLTVVVTLSCPDGSEITSSADPSTLSLAPQAPAGVAPWEDSAGSGHATWVSGPPTPPPSASPSASPSSSPTSSPNSIPAGTPSPSPSPVASSSPTLSPTAVPGSSPTSKATSGTIGTSSAGGAQTSSAGGWVASGSVGPASGAAESMPPADPNLLPEVTVVACLVFGGAGLWFAWLGRRRGAEVDGE
ncbi:MAG: hypothetical protein FWG11_02510 [Promicromonosporaceae bacterium]|nr:hypothetical protein [Promicromonosporaceae bacterium]